MVIFSFTLVSSLTMLVIGKEKDISVLHALGGNRNFIQRIFLSAGLLLTFMGAGCGYPACFVNCVVADQL